LICLFFFLLFHQEVILWAKHHLFFALRINHIHLIDSDNTCHKDDDGNDETSAHPPFGDGILDFDSIVPALAKENVGQDWWTVDLCFWPEAWDATEKCKKALDSLISKYG